MIEVITKFYKESNNLNFDQKLFLPLNLQTPSEKIKTMRYLKIDTLIWKEIPQ